MIELGGLAISEDALAWKFVRASGPGGQNVNKVSTAVECRLHLARAAFDEPVRERLERLAGNHLTSHGEIVVFADEQRSQGRNRAAALERLGALIAKARQTPKARIARAPSPAQKAQRRKHKRRRGEIKKQRRPPEDY